MIIKLYYCSWSWWHPEETSDFSKALSLNIRVLKNDQGSPLLQGFWGSLGGLSCWSSKLSGNLFQKKWWTWHFPHFKTQNFQRSGSMTHSPLCDPCRARGPIGWDICSHYPCGFSVFINRDMYSSAEISRNPHLAEKTNGAFPLTS